MSVVLTLILTRQHPTLPAKGDGSLVDQGDFCRPECFEGVETFDNSWMDGVACNPCLVLLGIHAIPLDYTEANVANVVVGHREVGASCECHAGEEAEDKCVKAVGGMPVGCHALTVCFGIFCHCLTVVVNKPHKHIDEKNVWLAKAPLLEGGVHLQ
jgi:hypothetical protein